jgi:hypothetical protein
LFETKKATDLFGGAQAEISESKNILIDDRKFVTLLGHDVESQLEERKPYVLVVDQREPGVEFGESNR